jgi:hypothetical protein
MKKLLFYSLLFLAYSNGNAQILDPKWTTKIEKNQRQTTS